MASKELVTKVWIEDGCIVCDACETSAPTVFHVTDDTCVIRPEAMTPDFLQPVTDEVVEAAEECPVDVIKFETVEGEAPEAAPKAPAAADEPAVAAVESAPAAIKTAAASVAAAPEPKAASVSKSPEKPAKVSVAGSPDPAIQALLRAATQRGGLASITKDEDGASPAVKAWGHVPADELPPDARQAKVVSAAKDAKADGSRRGFMAGSALGVGWMAFGGASVVSGLAFGRFMMPNVLEEPDPRVRVGPIDVYAAMSPGGVNIDTKPKGFWIIRLDEKIAALNIICTHLGCIPNWLPNDRKFKCPCHGSGYRQTGINFEGPAPRPLERFRIWSVDGLVMVDRSKKFQYEKGQWDQPESFIEV